MKLLLIGSIMCLLISAFTGLISEYNSGFDKGCETTMIYVYKKMGVNNIDKTSLPGFCKDVVKKTVDNS